MDEVYENLWIGDISDAQEESMGSRGISTVITVCQDSVEDNIGCDYHYYNMSDGPDNKYGGDHGYSIYSQASNRLYDSIRNGDKVLIHCHRGRSRSVSVAAGVIGRLEGTSADDALSTIKNSRPEANPDELLMEHARTYVEDSESI